MEKLNTGGTNILELSAANYEFDAVEYGCIKLMATILHDNKLDTTPDEIEIHKKLQGGSYVFSQFTKEELKILASYLEMIQTSLHMTLPTTTAILKRLSI